MAIHLQKNIFHPARLTAAEGCLDQWAYDVPNLRPTFTSWLPYRTRMLIAQRGPEGIVINLAEALTPPDKRLLAIGQDEPDHHLKGWRPGLDVADRSLGPVEWAHQSPHFASSVKAIAG
jgi:hypothetical protein